MYLEYYVGFERDPSECVSCIKVFRNNGDYSLECVSENNRRYWCVDPLFDATIHILKDSIAGKKITQMIDSRTKNEDIGDYLTKIVMNRIKPGELMDCMLDREKAAFENGKCSARLEIRKALGLYDEY